MPTSRAQEPSEELHPSRRLIAELPVPALTILNDLVYLNAPAQALCAYSAPMKLETFLWECFSSQSTAELFQGSTKATLRLTSKDQKARFVEICTFLHADAPVWLLHDNTAQLSLTESLRDSEARLRATIAAMPDMIFRLDRSGIFIDFDAHGEALAIPEDKIIGSSAWDLPFPQHVVKAMRAAVENAVDLAVLQELEYEVQLPTGTQFYELRVAKSAPNEAVCIIRNITSKKNADRELIDAQRAAQAASQAKSQFLAAMSHEVRTPLSGVIGMAELAMDTRLTQEQREYLEHIHDSSKSLLSIINDILDLSRIEADRLKIESVVFDLQNVLADAVRPFSLRPRPANVEFRVQVAPSLPQFVVGDPLRIRQIVTNLLSNAIKFTAQGQILLSVKSSQSSANWITIQVQDSGIGIPESSIQKIFEPFAQAENDTSQKYGGTGLGLAISRKLARLMNGDLTVDSRVGEGSCFYLELPLLDAKQVTPPMPITRLLVLGNRSENLDFLSSLEGYGIVVVSALSATPQNCEGISGIICDATSDISLPPSFLPKIPKVLLTEDRSLPRYLEWKARGFDACLVKPVFPKEVLDTLLRLLNQPKTEMSNPIVSSKTKLRVLVAEDNPVSRMLATRMLEKLGHEVAIADNGNNAVELANQSPFDVILMDLQMPGLDGCAATRAIREAEKHTGQHVRIIAITAHAMTSDVKRCLDAGMDKYLSKPVDPAKLIELLSQQVHQDPKA